MLLLAPVRRGLASESSSAVLEELLLPTVEDRRLEEQFVAQLGYGHVL